MLDNTNLASYMHHFAHTHQVLFWTRQSTLIHLPHPCMLCANSPIARNNTVGQSPFRWFGNYDISGSFYMNYMYMYRFQCKWFKLLHPLACQCTSTICSTHSRRQVKYCSTHNYNTTTEAHTKSFEWMPLCPSILRIYNMHTHSNYSSFPQWWREMVPLSTLPWTPGTSKGLWSPEPPQHWWGV